MESKEKREARLSQGRDCDGNIEVWKVLNRGKCNFLSREKEIELSVPLSLLLSDRRSCNREENK